MIAKFTQENIDQAIKILLSGGIIGLPTETVYGLAADAENQTAVKMIYSLKQRPSDHPLIVHIAGVELLEQWAIDIPDAAYQLAEAFWPGALTMILKKAPGVSTLVTAGQDTIAIRCPNHPVAQALLKQLNSGLVAPSANKFGQLSPTTAKHVDSVFGNDIAMVLDGGDCQVGIESTIVSLVDKQVAILRPGMISATAINKILNNTSTVVEEKQTMIRAPGMHKSHYAPRTPLIIVDKTTLDEQLRIVDKAILLSLSIDNIAGVDVVNMPNNPQQYARQLYATLHALDQKNYDVVLVESVPENEQWQAIKDRLNRAAHK